MHKQARTTDRHVSPKESQVHGSELNGELAICALLLHQLMPVPSPWTCTQHLKNLCGCLCQALSRLLQHSLASRGCGLQVLLQHTCVQHTTINILSMVDVSTQGQRCLNSLARSQHITCEVHANQHHCTMQ